MNVFSWILYRICHAEYVNQVWVILIIFCVIKIIDWNKRTLQTHVYGAPFVSKLIFSLVINFSSFSVLNHGFKRLKSERRTPWSFHHCFFVVIIRNTLVVYYELQSISCADRIYRPVIDQLKYYYIVLIFYQIHVKSISCCMIDQ